VSFSLDTSFLVSILFVDAHTAQTFAWLGAGGRDIRVSDWATTELFALVHRRVRAGLITADVAAAALIDFDAFMAGRARRLPHSASAGVLAASLARDPALKLSAPDALHLALAASDGLSLVTFDDRLADAAKARAYRVEML
jgi:predicted nucleic acid-binding protein